MQRDRIARLLPEIYQAALQPGSVLDAILQVMEAQHETAEAALAGLDATFDPRRADDAFVVMLATWVALGPLVEPPDMSGDGRRQRMMIAPANLRELTARAAELARARGTSASLITFLELATGVSGFAIDDDPRDAAGRPLPFAATLRVPAEASSFRDLIETIVAREKPAFTRVEIVFAGS